MRQKLQKLFDAFYSAKIIHTSTEDVSWTVSAALFTYGRRSMDCFRSHSVILRSFTLG